MKHTHTCQGTCSRQVSFEIDNEGRLHNIAFLGGCNGNTKGIAALAEGMDAREAAARMRNITCGTKASSCPAQLAQGIAEALNA